MNILIVGCGNGGTAVAADLSLKGHSITMLKTSKELNDHFLYLKEYKQVVIKKNGEKKVADLKLVTEDFTEAMSKDYDLIIIFIQTNFHEFVIKKLSQYLSNGQMILVEPGYLATQFFLEYCPDKDLIIIEAESSPIDCRITSPGNVKVLFENVRNPLGVYPSERRSHVEIFLRKLEYNFTYLNSVIEASLNNPNLIVHTIGAILSIPRIENTNGNYWMYKEVFTPTVWKLVEKLDEEKNNILLALNLNSIKYVDACKYRNSKDLSLNSKDIFMEYALNHSPKGPEVIDSRFITEDVPFGLVLLEQLGIFLGVETVATTSLINLANIFHSIDYRSKGRRINFEVFELILKDKKFK